MTDQITFTRDDSDRLVRVETNLDNVQQSQKELIALIKLQNGRVGKLEADSRKQKYFIAGVSAAISILVTGIGLLASLR